MPGSCFGFAPFAALHVGSLHARKRPRTAPGAPLWPRASSVRSTTAWGRCVPLVGSVSRALKKQGAKHKLIPVVAHLSERRCSAVVWRRVRSEISTFPCPHGPVAAATSDRTARNRGFRLRSASHAPRAHDFCHRLHLRPETMVRPTRAARAHGRSRVG